MSHHFKLPHCPPWRPNTFVLGLRVRHKGLRSPLKRVVSDRSVGTVRLATKFTWSDLSTPQEWGMAWISPAGQRCTCMLPYQPHDQRPRNPTASCHPNLGCLLSKNQSNQPKTYFLDGLYMVYMLYIVGKFENKHLKRNKCILGIV